MVNLGWRVPSSSSWTTVSFNFCSSSFVNPAKVEPEGDLGLLGDFERLDELGDLGSEFLGDLVDFDDLDLEWPGIGFAGVTPPSEESFWIFSQQYSNG